MEINIDNTKHIPGGAFLVPRAIIESEIWENKPSWWFKVWFYILSSANFKDHNRKLKRGDLLTTYDEIHRRCRLAREGVKPKAIDNLIRHLKSIKQITTRRTTRGFIITVLNYDNLQKFETYSYDTLNDAPNEDEVMEDRHDKGTNETNSNYNYLSKSSTYKGKDLGGKSQPSSKTQTKDKDPRMIFLANLNKVNREFIKYLSKKSAEQILDEEWSLNTHSCVKGIQYYLRKYKYVCGVDHVLMKLPQIEGCLINFNCVIYELEELNLNPDQINEVIKRAIDRWFATTSLDENNLRLNHFAGINKKGEFSFIIDNSVYEVLDELGLLRKEVNAIS